MNWLHLEKWTMEVVGKINLQNKINKKSVKKLHFQIVNKVHQSFFFISENMKQNNNSNKKMQ